MDIPTLKAPNENGVYKAVQANEDGNMPVVKAWDETSQQYVPVFALMGGSGVELPVLTNPGAAANLESGYQLIDGDGNVVEGTATINVNDFFTVNNTTETEYQLFSCPGFSNWTESVFGQYEYGQTSMNNSFVVLVCETSCYAYAQKSCSLVLASYGGSTNRYTSVPKNVFVFFIQDAATAKIEIR